jgi:hypothetical protein
LCCKRGVIFLDQLVEERGFRAVVHIANSATGAMGILADLGHDRILSMW